MLGEVVLNLDFVASPGQVGLHSTFGKACLGLLSTFALVSYSVNMIGLLTIYSAGATLI